MAVEAAQQAAGSATRVPSPPLSPDKDFSQEAGTTVEAFQFLRSEKRTLDRLERLLDSERRQREEEVAGLRKQLEAQEASISELKSQCKPKPECAEGAEDLQELLPRLLEDVRALQAGRQDRDEAFVAEGDRQQAALAEFQRQLATLQETQTWQTSHSETLFEYMHRDLELLREKVHQQAHADEEARVWYQAARQTNGDLSRRVMEVSASVEGCEKVLRAELEAMRSDSDAFFARQRTEINELSLNLADERKQRELEAHDARGRLEGACNQLLELQDTISTAAASDSSPAAPPPEEVASLRVSLEAVEAVRRELVRLEAAASEASAARVEDIAALRNHAEDAARGEMERCSERLECDLARRLSEALTEEQASRANDLSDLRSRTEDVHALRAELSLLKSTLQAFVEECRRCATAVVRTEADAEEMEAESRKTACLVFGPRLEALEAWCREQVAAVNRDQEVAVGRVQALEAELRQARQSAAPPAASPGSGSPPLPCRGSSPRLVSVVDAGIHAELTPTVMELYHPFHRASSPPAMAAQGIVSGAVQGRGGGGPRAFVAARPQIPTAAYQEPAPAPQACDQSVESSGFASPRPGPGQASGAASPQPRRPLHRPCSSPLSPRLPQRGPSVPSLARCTSPSRQGVRVAGPEGGEAQATYVLHPVLPTQALSAPLPLALPAAPQPAGASAGATAPPSMAATPAPPPPGAATPAPGAATPASGAATPGIVTPGVVTPVTSIPPTPVPAWRGSMAAGAPPPPATHVGALLAVRSPNPGAAGAAVSFWTKPQATAREGQMHL